MPACLPAAAQLPLLFFETLPHLRYSFPLLYVTFKSIAQMNPRPKANGRLLLLEDNTKYSIWESKWQPYSQYESCFITQITLSSRKVRNWAIVRCCLLYSMTSQRLLIYNEKTSKFDLPTEILLLRSVLLCAPIQLIISPNYILYFFLSIAFNLSTIYSNAYSNLHNFFLW